MPLRDLMSSDEGWGRPAGRVVSPKLVAFVEANPGISIFRMGLDGVRRMDISFASETLVEVARRFRARKGFCLINLVDPDMRENIDAAAIRASQPLVAWNGEEWTLLGPKPPAGAKDAFEFAMSRTEVRATDYQQAMPNMSIANASNKFRKLWDQGFLLRREVGAESGGVEFVYFAIR